MIKIKQLDWQMLNCGQDEDTCFARVPGFDFRYEIPPKRSGSKFEVRRSIDIQPFAWRETMDEAKQAAYEDLCSRIGNLIED